MRYNVKFGDSPTRIAREYGVPFDALIRANPFKPTTVVAGRRTWVGIAPNEEIIVPVGGMVGDATSDVLSALVAAGGPCLQRNAALVCAVQRALGVTVDGKYGSGTSAAAKAVFPGAPAGCSPTPSWWVKGVNACPSGGGAVVPAPAPIPVSIAPTATAGSTYLVKAGDTGERIAAAYTGDKNRWSELLTVNPTLRDPTYGIKLYTGKTINLPASWGGATPTYVPPPVQPPPIAPTATAGSTYLVKAGDTGERIAAAYTGDKNRWSELLTVNPTLRDPTYGIKLYTGKTINLPASWGGATPTYVPPPVQPPPISPPVPQVTPTYAPPPVSAPPPAALPDPQIAADKADAIAREAARVAAELKAATDKAAADKAAADALAKTTGDATAARLAEEARVALQALQAKLDKATADALAKDKVATDMGGAGSGSGLVAPEEKKGLSTGAIVAGAVGIAALVGLIAVAASGKSSSTTTRTTTRRAPRRAAPKRTPAKRKSSPKRKKKKR